MGNILTSVPLTFFRDNGQVDQSNKQVPSNPIMNSIPESINESHALVQLNRKS